MRFVLRMNYGEDVIWLLQDKECEISVCQRDNFQFVEQLDKLELVEQIKGYLRSC